jgi:WD40 repeat protein
MELRGHLDAVTALAFAPDGATLLTASLDKTARLWDLRTGREISSLPGQTDSLIGVAFAPDGCSFFTRSLDGTVTVWSVDGRLVSRFQIAQ